MEIQTKILEKQKTNQKLLRQLRLTENIQI